MAALPTGPYDRRARAKRASGALRAGLLIVVALSIGATAVVVGFRSLGGERPTESVPLSDGMAAVEATAAPTTTSVEMPHVVGLDLQSAEMVLSAVGMRIQVSSQSASADKGSHRVVDQDPEAGELTDQSATATLYVVSGEGSGLGVAAQAKATKRKSPRKRPPVVCIDPGHQARSDSSPEAIAPGAKLVKPRVSGGATGVKTLIPEYEIALQVATNLKSRLEARGVKVVMTRTTNDVDLSNAERAAIANKARADLFIRIHADGSPNHDAAGVLTLYPDSNKWTKSIAARSKRAARAVHHSVVMSTDAIDRGTAARSDQSGFNWSKVPAVLVECGSLSNPIEDRLLASPHYQDKVAEGIAAGTMDYLRSAQ